MTVYTVQEAASKLKVTQRTIYRMIDDGRLPARKVGRSWRITSDAIDTLLGTGQGSSSSSRGSQAGSPGASPPASQSAVSQRHAQPVQETRAVYQATSSARGITDFTYEHYRHLPDDVQYQVLQGFLVCDPAPTTNHQQVELRLVYKLFGHVQDQGLGSVYLAPTDVILDSQNILQPDILFVTKTREAVITERAVEAAPDLVVEVLSPTTRERDATTKRMLYARFGVREYWLVDPRAAVIEIHTAPMEEKGIFEKVTLCRPGDTAVSQVVEGFSVPLDELFAGYLQNGRP